MQKTLVSIDHGIQKVVLLIAQVALCSLVLLVTANVVLRYAFGMGIKWSEEVPSTLVALFAFLACAMGVRDHLHVAVSVIYNRFPEGGKGRKVLDILTDLCSLLVGLFMLYYGYQYFAKMRQFPNNKLPMTGWPRWVQYFSVPIAGLVITYDSLLFLFGVIKPDDKIFSDTEEDPMDKALRLRAEQLAEEAAKLEGGKA